MTKPVTAVGIMILMEEGRLAIGDRVEMSSGLRQHVGHQKPRGRQERRYEANPAAATERNAFMAMAASSISE